MRCNEVQGHIADYLNDTLPEALHGEVREHLGSCQECGEETAGLAEVWRIGRAIPPDPPNSAAMRSRFDRTLATYLHEAATGRVETDLPAKRGALTAGNWPKRIAFQAVFVVLMAVGLFAAQKAVVLVMQGPAPSIENHAPVFPTATGPSTGESQSSPETGDLQTPASQPVQHIVSGHIRGTFPESGTGAGAATLRLDGPGYTSTRVTVDGAFEFRGVAPGDYTLTPSGSLFPSPPQRIVIADRDLTDVVVPAPVRVEVRGRIVSGAGKAAVTGELPMSIGNGNPGTSCECVKVHSVDGTFSVLLPEGTYQFRVGRFNSVDEVNAMTYGGSNALNLPITVTRSAPAELRITLASTAPTIGVREATQGIPPAPRGTPAGNPADTPKGAVRPPAPDEVRGQLYTDGDPPRDFRVESLKILLTPEGGTSRLQADANADGSFIFRNADPNARYKVSIEGFSVPGYLVAGRYGGADPLAAAIEIEPGTPLQLQIGFQPGSVEVLAQDGTTPVAGTPVTLVPEARNRSGLSRKGATDLQGKTTFDNVVPGNYTIVVGEVKDTDKPVAQGQQGRSIRVTKGTTTFVTIQTRP